MADMMAAVWVEESDDSNKMSVTIAIEGQDTEVYLMDRNIWESLEPGIRNGHFLTRWMSRTGQKSSVKAAKGTVKDRELDVST